jgi:hypothetical protein
MPVRVGGILLALLLGGCGAGEPVPGDVPHGVGASSSPPQVATLAPGDGELRTQMVAGAARLRAEGRVPYLHVTASWCGPCKALRSLWDEPQLQAAMRGAGFLRVDLDAFAEPLAALGVQRTVPAFYEIRPDGSVGRTINGAAWGEDTVENIAPPLESYFQRGAGADLSAAQSTVQGTIVRLADGVPADAAAERVITVAPRTATSAP